MKLKIKAHVLAAFAKANEHLGQYVYWSHNGTIRRGLLVKAVLESSLDLRSPNSIDQLYFIVSFQQEKIKLYPPTMHYDDNALKQQSNGAFMAGRKKLL